MKALRIAEIISEKKAVKPVVLDMGSFSTICDYFVICSGETDTHVRAIYDGMIKQAYNEHISIHHFEDDGVSQWLLIDFFDVVLHIFIAEAREFYNLEYLWRDAKKVRLSKADSKIKE